MLESLDHMALMSLLGSLRGLLGGVTRAPAKEVASGLCFIAGMPILTEIGLKPIEEIKEGDTVFSYNERRKQNEYKTVIQMIVRERAALCVKGNWSLDSSIQNKIVAMAFSMASEIERDLIVEVTI